MTTSAHTIEWRHNLDEALANAAGKAVLLDFSAAPM
jgi:hypothetical protein